MNNGAHIISSVTKTVTVFNLNKLHGNCGQIKVYLSVLIWHVILMT